MCLKCHVFYMGAQAKLANILHSSSVFEQTIFCLHHLTLDFIQAFNKYLLNNSSYVHITLLLSTFIFPIIIIIIYFNSTITFGSLFNILLPACNFYDVHFWDFQTSLCFCQTASTTFSSRRCMISFVTLCSSSNLFPLRIISLYSYSKTYTLNIIFQVLKACG